MATIIDELLARVGADTSGWVSGFRDAIAVGNAFATRTIPPIIAGIQSIQSGINRMAADWGRAFTSIATAAQRTGLAIGAAATAMTAALVKTGIGFDDLKQKSLLAFETMLGSAERAKGFFSELTDFATRTPFQLTGLLETSQQLIALGFQGHEIIPTLTTVGDAVSGLGGSPEKLNRIIIALGQMRAKGKVSAQEMNQLAESGIGAWDMLARKIGVDIPTAMKMAENGAISSAVAIPAILEGMNSRFGGLMERMSSTFTGRMSNIVDKMQVTAGQIVEPLFEAASSGLQTILNAFESPSVAGAVKGLQERFAELGGAIGKLLQGSGQEIVQRLVQLFASMVEITTRVATAAVQAAPRVLQMADGFARLMAPIGEFIAAHPEIVAGFAVFTGAQFLGIIPAVTAIATALATTAAVLVGTVIPAIVSMATAIGSALAPEIIVAIGICTAWLAALTAAAGGVVAIGFATGNIQRVFAELWSEIQMGVTELMPELFKTWEQLQIVGLVLWNTVKQIADAFGDALVAGIRAAYPYVVDVAKELLQMAQKILPRIADFLSKLGPLFAYIGRLFQTALVTGAKLFGETLLWVMKVIDGLLERTLKWVDAIQDAVTYANALKTHLGNAKLAAQDVELERSNRQATRKAALEGHGQPQRKAAGGGAGGFGFGGFGEMLGGIFGGAKTFQGPNELGSGFDGQGGAGPAEGGRNRFATKDDPLGGQGFLDQFRMGSNRAEKAANADIAGQETRFAQAGEALANLGNEIDQLRIKGRLTAAQQQDFGFKMANLQELFAIGSLSENEFAVALDGIKQEMDAITASAREVQQATEGFGESLRKMKFNQQLSGKEVEEFSARMQKLQNDLARGVLSVEEFGWSIEDLEKQARDRAAANEDAKKQKEQEGQYPGKFVERFGTALYKGQSAITQFSGELVTAGRNAREAFGDMGEKMQQGLSNFAVAAQNVGVQIALVQNRLSLEWQRYRTLMPINSQAAMRVLDVIKGLEQQMREMTAPRAPLFSEFNAAGILRDPGLQ